MKKKLIKKNTQQSEEGRRTHLIQKSEENGIRIRISNIQLHIHHFHFFVFFNFRRKQVIEKQNFAYVIPIFY